MALFNKLFTNRKGTHKQQHHVSDKYFAFSKDQVRVVLFRECDFRGRKLLFDSNSVKKVPLVSAKSGKAAQEENEKYFEVSEGFGYLYSKPEPDFNQLAEMVFGSVAMSFRGTYLKMHTLECPNRLMFSQVFSSPRFLNDGRVSVSSRGERHSSEHSRLDESGCSSNSMSEQLSVHSTMSDTILVCRRPFSSSLSAPEGGISLSIPSLTEDSGYDTISNGNSSTWGSMFSDKDASTLSISSCSLYKRWLRKTSTSLENSAHLLANCNGESPGHPHGSIKLGLTLILCLTSGEENELSAFILEHLPLLESILWRVRRSIEAACCRSQHWLSLMVEVSRLAAQHLVHLLSGPRLRDNLWRSLAAGCDSYVAGSSEYPRGFAKFLKSESGDGATPEGFLQDFCELLENVDVKNTNFFMSTLLTAVLTYHLGWVSTCLPTALSSSKHPFNPLWGAWSDLYGAVGHPTKIAQTVITGTNKRDLVSRILLSMTYFIRCSDVDRCQPIRADAEGENRVAEEVCRSNAAIPKENYKRYEDHLKEIWDANRALRSKEIESIVYEDKDLILREDDQSTRKLGGLAKTHTCLGDLSSLDQHLESSYCFDTENNNPIEMDANKDVVFVLGDDERLVGLRKQEADTSVKRKSSFVNVKPLKFQDCDFGETSIKASTSHMKDKVDEEKCAIFSRDNTRKNGMAYRYSGVKFNLQQHPQILCNYMKSKNVEMSNLQLGEKSLKLDELSALSDAIVSKYPDVEDDFEEGEALQTPSNASELEFTSDLPITPPPLSDKKNWQKTGSVHETNSLESSEKKMSEILVVPNVIGKRTPNVPKNCYTERKKSRGKSENDACCSVHKMKVTVLPMPRSMSPKAAPTPMRYSSSLMKAASDSYTPNMVLQGPTLPKAEWESSLKSDLVLASQHSPIDQPVEEAVAVVANTDTWEVHLMSSRTFLPDRQSVGLRVGMSQLVSNMLESLVQMWRLKAPPQQCLQHIERTLQELCVRSKALSELLLAADFCDMEQLTAALHLEVNDVPLLLAVASTHSPQVTSKYGLSFH